MAEPAMPFQVNWAVKGAVELEYAQRWMKENLAGVWKAELLGVRPPDQSDDKSEPRVEIRYSFESRTDFAAFATKFPDAVTQTVDAAAADSAESVTQFEESARQILTTSEPVSAGRLQLLGLDRVQAHFGDEWARMQPRVETMVKRAIEKRLGPRDAYRNAGGLNYTILFADLSHAEASFKCGMMVDEISRMLLGDEMQDMLTVQSVAAPVESGRLLQKLSEPGQISAEIDEIVEQEQRRQVAAARAEFEIREEFDPLSNVRVSYRPIWDVRRSVVASFLCLTMRHRAGGDPIPFDVAALSNCDETVRQNLDSLVLDKVIDDLAIMHQKNRRLMLCVPVHFESVSAPTRRRNFLAPWERVPPVYQKLIIFEIIDWPVGVPQGRVAEIVSTLKPVSAGVFARVPLASLALRNFANAGLIAVGVDLGASKESEEFLVKEFQRFVQLAENANLLSYIHGLTTFSLTLAAITSGFSLINGGAISAIAEHPDAGYRFNIDDLYSRILPKPTE